MRSVLLSAERAGLRWWFFLCTRDVLSGPRWRCVPLLLTPLIPPVHTFTSLIIQSSVLLRAPTCMLAEDIRADFREGMQIFKNVAPLSPLAQRALVILLKVEQAVEGTCAAAPHALTGPASVPTGGTGDVRIVIGSEAAEAA